MFIHCHNCNFTQDDFWDKDYNPIRSSLTWEQDLLTKDLDEVPEWADKNWTWREILATDLEKRAVRIRGMVYPTYEEYCEKNPDGVCPKCGQKELSVD